MSSSIEQQRASVQKQITSMTGKTTAPGSFFTVPWVDGMASRFIPPPCDPMATAELDQLIEKLKRAGREARSDSGGDQPGVRQPALRGFL